MNNQSSDLVLRIIGGSQDGNLVSISTSKCLLSRPVEGASGQLPECAIFRGANGVAARSYSGEMVVNGQPTDLQWLAQGDVIQLDSMKFQIHQLGFCEGEIVLEDGAASATSSPDSQAAPTCESPACDHDGQCQTDGQCKAAGQCQATQSPTEQAFQAPAIQNLAAHATSELSSGLTSDLGMSPDSGMSPQPGMDQTNAPTAAPAAFTESAAIGEIQSAIQMTNQSMPNQSMSNEGLNQSAAQLTQSTMEMGSQSNPPAIAETISVDSTQPETIEPETVEPVAAESVSVETQQQTSEAELNDLFGRLESLTKAQNPTPEMASPEATALKSEWEQIEGTTPSSVSSIQEASAPIEPAPASFEPAAASFESAPATISPAPEATTNQPAEESSPLDSLPSGSLLSGLLAESNEPEDKMTDEPKKNESVADVLARMQSSGQLAPTILDDDEQPGMTAVAEPPAPAPTPAPEPAPVQATVEDDEDVDACVSQWFSKYKNDQNDGAGTKEIQEARQQEAEVAAAAELAAAEPVAPVDPLTSETFKPKAQVLEKNRDLSALREIANSSSRSAVQTSNAARRKAMGIMQLALLVGGIGMAGILFMWSAFSLSDMKTYFGAFSLLAGLFAGFRFFMTASSNRPITVEKMTNPVDEAS